MILRFHLQRALAFSFAALGPLGNLLTPGCLPDSFRTYYFLLPWFPVFFLSFREQVGKIALFFLPFLLYCFVSALMVEERGISNEPDPLLRFFLFLCQFFFVVGAAAVLKKREEIFKALKLYLNFYFVSLFIGYFFLVGYYLELIPLSLLSRFSILTQFGFGLLRFSPGSYPNEYGIVSSFILSLLVLILFEKKEAEFHYSRRGVQFFFVLTFIALLLTTTRAAYISFVINFIYLLLKSRQFLKKGILSLAFFFAVFGLLLFFKINMFQILWSGFTQNLQEGSLGERYFIWLETIERARNHPIWGMGFASLTNIHNVYFQILFELGVIGTLFLIGTLFISLLETTLKKQRVQRDEFLSKIRIVGLINVLSFAVSNHNLNHHLTWFVCFLSLALPRKRPSSAALEAKP